MKLAIYDFDGTYMKTEVLRKVFEFWKKQELNNNAYNRTWSKIVFLNIIYKMKIFGLSKQTFRKNCMSLTANLFGSISKEALNKFLNDLYLYLQDQINQDLKEQLKKDKENGYHTILLSGNFNCILEPFLKEGFDEVIGSVARVNDEMLKPKDIKIIISNRKAETIKSRFPEADLEASKAMADSIYDLPVLEIVGETIAYHPDKGLLKIAKERGYKIWKRTE